MAYYTIQSCNVPGPSIIGQVIEDSGVLQVGWYIQTSQNPGVCFLITGEFSDDQLSPIYNWVGPAFSSCTNCVNGITLGCTDESACNFNPCATIDDGSCTYNNATIVIRCNNPITSCL
jgi:hypothetical protein